MARLVRLVSALAVAFGSTVVTGDANVVAVPLTSSPNPSVVGQMVVFRIQIGTWCDYGGHPFQVMDNGTVIGYAQIPYPGNTYATFATALLSAGTHRMSAETPYCYYQPNQIVIIGASDLVQVVNPKPAPPAPPHPPPLVAAPPPPPPPSPPSPSPTASEEPSPTVVTSPSPATATRIQSVAQGRVLTDSQTPPGLVAGAGIVVLFGAVGRSLAGGAASWRAGGGTETS